MHEAVAYHRNGGEAQDILEIDRQAGGEIKETLADQYGAVPYRHSAGLSIEGAGLVARDIKLHIFLVDPLVAIHTILFRIVIHSVVPPIEQGIGLSPIHRISIIASGIFLNHPAGDIIDLAIALERIQHQEEPTFVIIMLVNSCREVWFERKDLFRPSSRSGKEENKGEGENGNRQP
jgi:hypothetical protein